MKKHITKTKGKRKSCRICKNSNKNFCKAFNISITSYNNATYCKKFIPQDRYKKNFKYNYSKKTI